MDNEIQQRAIEYSQLFGLDRDLRSALLENMPVLADAANEESLKGTGAPLLSSPPSKKAALPETPKSPVKNNGVLDLVFGDTAAVSENKSLKPTDVI